MKAVLDSNVLLVAIGNKSRYRPVWQTFLSTRYQLVISGEIAFEYEEILQKYGAPGADAVVLEILAEAPNVLYKRIHYPWKAIGADPDDNKFFDAAIAANADYPVTNDAHFNAAKTLAFPKVNIISADDFLSLLQGSV